MKKFKDLVKQNYREPVDGKSEDATKDILKTIGSESESDITISEDEDTEPLENFIRTSFIPTFLSRDPNAIRRDLFALPCHLGRLGVLNPISFHEL